MTIWKYELPSQGEVNVAMPKGAKVLTVQEQGDAIQLWAIVDDRKPSIIRHFSVRLTGQCGSTFTNDVYVGTVQLAKGKYVAHVFEVRR